MAADNPHDRPTADGRASHAKTTPEPKQTGVARTLPAVSDARLNTTFGGRYRILEKLGQGGMGVVYLAEHALIEKKFAIKVLSDELVLREELLVRFQQEAKAASRIGHENIIDITDFGKTEGGAVYIVMEYLKGRDLARHVRGSTPMDAVRAERIMNQVCRALAAAHAEGIFHRDLKPDNIFLVERQDRADFVKILDFGLAKVTGADQRGGPMTAAGTVFGTAEYMSPEQARGEVSDHRTDVYAAGCILYEMLTGHVPFRGDDFMLVLYMQQFDEPIPPSQRAPDRHITPEVEAVVLKALAKDRERRFQSMKDLALALNAAVGGDAKLAWGTSSERAAQPATVIASARSDQGRKRSGRWLWLAAPIAFAGAAVAFLAWPRPAPAPPPPPIVVLPTAPALPPAPIKSHISIRSAPADADVMRGAERLGRTPLELDLASDTAPFDVTLVKAGRHDTQLHVAPDRNREYVVQMSRTASKPAPPKPQEPEPVKKPPRELKDVLSE